jgi:lysophospholipase L1-like esterase
MLRSTKFIPAVLVTSLILSAAVWADDKPANPSSATPAATPAATPKPLPVQPPDVPAVKYDPKTGEPNKGFLAAHDKYVATAKEGKAQLLFLGDSITAGWASKGKAVWDKSFTQWQPANFGIGGDRTQHVLWRIENGELDGIKPKAAVVMIGTNNVGGDTAEGIASGVKKIIDTIRAKTPDTKILLLAVFPRGEKASPNPGREKLAKVNEIISKLADNQHVFYLDIGAKFLQPDGSISKDIMPDFLHPSEAGYQIWADAITPKLTDLMK